MSGKKFRMRENITLRALLGILSLVSIFPFSRAVQANVAEERKSLETRVLEIRLFIHEPKPDTPAKAKDGTSGRMAQWGNWPNWSNWNNWPNWGNWGNWFNR